MEKIANDIRLLFDRKAVDLASKEPDISRTNSQYVPVVKKTVGYIVCGIIFDNLNQVLMMQEAKSSCFGTWYAPAGRVEPGENLTDAVKREVLEETGLLFDPLTLICVEFGSGRWYRFTFTGKTVGGSLKDSSRSDSESLQAKWISYSDIKTGKIRLRSKDILPLLELGLQYKKRSPESCHGDCLPVQIPHKRLFLRMVIAVKTDSDVKLLVKLNTLPYLPVTDIAPDDWSLFMSVFFLLRDAFGQHSMEPKICGILSVEHCGLPAAVNDGICLTCVFSLNSSDEEQLNKFVNQNYQWYSVSDPELKNLLLHSLTPGMSVPLIDLHSY
ncbi:8-oxo-dGDP phosphatase NUDT18 [Octopus bimaculoides]|uniref:Nudix hydrolase domain-containing protein n=1 Tax=Octopus bimaculoides TaxID=37653 RepID=A0A0L8FNZ4_OCTBM|nr:8-oxo-dGDP phosphatase NUDT18 [Octopus bimaculoides]|eukprot:XP_014788370.1 PREDICTED: 8-oxo-dGDP phosphatase NUDT18-like [Octopus bimaculoides]